MTPTWESFARLVLARHRFARREAREVRVVLAIGEAPATRVGLRVRPATMDGELAIEIAADLGTMARIDPWAGLRTNTLLSHGALAIEGETLVLRAVLPIATLTDDELELRLQLVAAEAAALKKEMEPAHEPTDAFDHYAE